jgi:hypothetical protein
MKILSAIGGGLAGALALTVLHEISRRIDKDAPRMDLLGMDALAKGLQKTGQPVPEEDKLFNLTLAADLVSNTLYYGLAAAGNKKYMIPKGSLLGLAAGAGAILLPKSIGLNPKHSNKTLKTQLLTTAFYITGGLIASAVAKTLEGKTEKRIKIPVYGDDPHAIDLESDVKKSVMKWVR